MNDEGPACGLKRQLMTTVPPLRWTSAVSVAGVGGDAQPTAATDSKVATRTATRFMVSSLATIVLLLRRGAAELVASIAPVALLAPNLVSGLYHLAKLGHLLVVGLRVALGGRGEASLAAQA